MDDSRITSINSFPSLNPQATIFIPISETTRPNLSEYKLNPLAKDFCIKLNPKVKPFIPVSGGLTEKRETQGQQSETANAESLLDTDPSIPDLEILTPNTSSVGCDLGEVLTGHDENANVDDVFIDFRERGIYLFVFVVSLTVLFALLLGPRNVSSDEEDPYTVLQSLRLKNIDRIILGHININSIRNKIDLLVDMISNRVDILLISETKIDDTFPKSQFIKQGYSEPYRLDRTAHGGGLLLYVRNDIPSKQLPLVEGSIECIFMEATISKKKWLFVGAYNPKKAAISNFLTVLEKSLNHYLLSYDNVVVLGDLNNEVHEEALENFCESYSLKSLIKTPTCFKSQENPTCIDVILTNKHHSFQNSTTLETGLSDFHLLTLTVMKTSFRKLPPKKVLYRDSKNYNSANFRNDVIAHFAGKDLTKISHDQYMSEVMVLFNHHKPVKTKFIRGNDQPFMTKELRKQHDENQNLGGNTILMKQIG